MDDDVPLPVAPVDGKIPIFHPTAKKLTREEMAWASSDPKSDEIQKLKEFVPEELLCPMKHKPTKPQPLQIAVHASVRCNERNVQCALVGISPHYIFAIAQDGDAWKEVFKVHVLTIKKLYYGTNYSNVYFLMVRLFSVYEGETKTKPKYTITCKNPRAIQLTLSLYRNLSLAYSTAYSIVDSKADPNLKPTIATEFPEAIPNFEPDLSPAQQFQFSYYALCTLGEIPYNHEVVRYFHYQVVNHNGLFNVSYLPLDFAYDGVNLLKDLKPVFRALIYVPYVFGIVCDSVARPEIFKAAALQLLLSQSVQLLHFSNVGATEGLNELAESLEENRTCPIKYIDFSRNQLTDFSGWFTRALSFRETNIFYLNFNHCSLTEELLLELFRVMKSNKCLHELKYLHIAGSMFTEEARQSFEEYLSELEIDDQDRKPGGCLKSLDFGDMTIDIQSALEILTNHPQPLANLMLYRTEITKDSFRLLFNLAATTRTLAYLDVSYTGLNESQVASLAFAMSERQGPCLLTLKICGLGLHGAKLTKVIQGFLRGSLNRWKSIWLDDNRMKVGDLNILSAILRQMPNLEELSLSGNFDSGMEGIERGLIELLRIPRLRRLKLQGMGDKHLGLKVKPLLFAMGLSYVVRSMVGGLAINNVSEEFTQWKRKAAEAMVPLFEMHGPLDAREFVPTLISTSLDDVLWKMIRDEQARRAQVIICADSAETRKRAESMIPLLRAVTKGLSVPRPIATGMKTIGYLATDIVSRWTDAAKKKTLEHDIPGLTSWLVEIMEANTLELASLARLEELDLRNNYVQISGLEAIGELIRLDKELRGIEFDGCAVDTIQSLVALVDIICEEDQRHITRMNFPINDITGLIKRTAPRAKRLVAAELRAQQQRMARVIDRNRAENGEFMELPFEICTELEDLIVSLTELQQKYLDPYKVRSHSGICEHFELQLPYLEEDPVFVGLPDDYREIDIGDQVAYMAPGMKKRYDEFDEFVTPLQMLALQRRRVQFRLPEPEPEQEKKEEEEEVADPVDMSELEKVLGVKAKLANVDSTSDGGSGEDDVMDKYLPEGNSEVDKVDAPSLDLNDTSLETPNFYEGELDEVMLNSSASGIYGPRFTRQFGKLKRDYTPTDLSGMKADVNFKTRKRLPPPPKT